MKVYKRGNLIVPLKDAYRIATAKAVEENDYTVFVFYKNREKIGIPCESYVEAKNIFDGINEIMMKY